MKHAPRAAPDDLDLIGHRLLERYRVDERIARGGMSTVYRGWDERLLRPVCIKLFREVDGAEECRRTVHSQFVREAYTLSQLNHPHTLRIYDFGRTSEDGGVPFQISELAEGGTLRDLVRRQGALGLERALALLEPIAGALSEAHGKGIVHRDIKPSNVLLCRAGQETVVKLADFGIAMTPIRGPEVESWTDGDEPAMYSLNWAAPEQLRQDPVSPATDVYSLALVAAFVISGRILFAGDHVETLFRDRRGGDELLGGRIKALHLPASVTATLLRACRHEPAQRTASAEGFLQALRYSWEEDERERTSVAHGLSEDTGTYERRSPAAESASTSVVTLEEPVPTELFLGQRLAHVMYIGDAVDLNWRAGNRAVRLRASALGVGGIHLKGLDCFLSRPGGRASSGTSVIDGDATLGLVSAGRQDMGSMRVQLGERDEDGRFFRVGGTTVRVPFRVAPWAVVLDGENDAPTMILLRGVGSDG